MERQQVKRLSTSIIKEQLQQDIDILCDRWGINVSGGTSQVRGLYERWLKAPLKIPSHWEYNSSSGAKNMGEEFLIAWGKYQALSRLLDDIEDKNFYQEVA